MSECDACKGAGEIVHSVPGCCGPRWNPMTADCPCGGYTEEYERCDACNGSGEVNEEEEKAA